MIGSNRQINSQTENEKTNSQTVKNKCLRQFKNLYCSIIFWQSVFIISLTSSQTLSPGINLIQTQQSSFMGPSPSLLTFFFQNSMAQSNPRLSLRDICTASRSFFLAFVPIIALSHLFHKLYLSLVPIVNLPL